MNLLECTVIEVLQPPYEMYGRWWVKVKFECYGKIDEFDLMCEDREQAGDVIIGYEFYA